MSNDGRNNNAAVPAPAVANDVANAGANIYAATIKLPNF